MFAGNVGQWRQRFLAAGPIIDVYGIVAAAAGFARAQACTLTVLRILSLGDPMHALGKIALGRALCSNRHRLAQAAGSPGLTKASAAGCMHCRGAARKLDSDGVGAHR